jgi:pilus assembly protein FimV
VVSLLAPVSGHSLGIGDIRVRSALNQNLSAEISLVASRGESPSNIKVSLASPEKFDEAGVPWSYFLSKIKFQPIVKPNGSMVIKVSSREALKEPYLNFLLEVSWPKGSLYREFTVLVDPPTEYQAPTTYQEPAYQEPAYPLTSRYENTLPQQQEYAPPRQRRVRHSAKPRRSSAGNYGEQITTRRNDTLWNVAERARGAGVSVEQMMIALYEKNPHAFFQQNVNALSAGKILKIPDKDAVQQSSRQEALAEFGRQNDAWNNNRSSIPAGEAQLAKGDEVDSQLKLVAPTDATVAQNEAVSPSSEQASGNSNTATPDGQQATTDKASAKAPVTPVDEALQSKMAALEKQMAMMQELIALKDKQLADLQNPGQATAPATQTPPAQITPPPVPAEQVKPEVIAPTVPVPPVQTAPIPVKPVQPVAPVKPIVKPVVKPPVQAAEPVAEETDSSLLWIIGGIGMTVLSLFGWLWWRKRKTIEDTDAESMFRNYSTMRNSDSTGLFSSAARKKIPGAVSGESSFLNDFKASDFESFESFNVDHGDIDPVAEADVYLAYGRYQQAEDLIRQAIKDFPDRDECKLKLLEIFHASANKDAFESYAAELVAAGKKDDKEFWRKVVEFSKDVCPDSEMFAASGTTAVFATESLADNVLFSPFDDLSNELGTIQGSEHLGAATFEVTDIESEQSHILDETSEEPSVQHRAEPVVEVVESPEQESGIELGLFEDDLAGQQDNETIDFDLGPYPEATQKTETVTSPPLDTHAFSSDTSTQFDDSDDNAEVESYEFDFNMDKPEPTKPVKPEPTQVNETWDSSQTIDFAIDDVASTDTFGDDTIDFSFDLESAQLDNDTPASKDQGFMVSDLTDMDELETKLDLAKAYIDMGDADAAKEIIEQVLEHGSPEQKKTAQELMDDLSLG